MAKKSSFFKKKKEFVIGDNCLSNRRPLLVLSNSITVHTLWQYPVCGQSWDRGQAVAGKQGSGLMFGSLAAWNFDKHLVNSDCC
jgi:hypothetical protein